MADDMKDDHDIILNERTLPRLAPQFIHVPTVLGGEV